MEMNEKRNEMSIPTPHSCIPNMALVSSLIMVANHGFVLNLDWRWVRGVWWFWGVSGCC